MDRRRVRVLLIEDDEDDYLLTRDLLADIDAEGFDLEWVSTYEAGLAAAARGGHDVCLLDYRLDGRTGLDLYRSRRRTPPQAPPTASRGQISTGALTTPGASV